jgi:hypothetical protein
LLELHLHGLLVGARREPRQQPGLAGEVIIQLAESAGVTERRLTRRRFTPTFSVLGTRGK